MHTMHAKQASKSCRTRRRRGRIHLFATNLATRGTRVIARMSCCQKNRCSIVSESHCKQCAGCKQAKHADKHGGGGKLTSARACLDEACRMIFESSCYFRGFNNTNTNTNTNNKQRMQLRSRRSEVLGRNS